MRFRKNVPAEHREFLQEQLKQYKKEITMSKDELRELEKWVASGRSQMCIRDRFNTRELFP